MLKYLRKQMARLFDFFQQRSRQHAFYEPIPISHNREHRKPVQSRSSDFVQFKICCRGKVFMNFGARRFKKY
jgi:hypothetical protein